MLVRIAWIALMFMLAALACAQDVGIVKDIHVEGNSRVSRDAILATMTTKVGTAYSQAKLDADQQALMDLGFFSAVYVTGTPVDNGKNFDVLVQVQEYPVVKEFSVKGNTVISTDDILKALSNRIHPGMVFNARDRDAAVQVIEDLYTKNGYYARVANFAPLPDAPQTLEIVILEEKVGIVSVQGNKFTKDWVMRRLIKTRSGQVFKISTWTNDLRRMLNTQWFESVRSSEDTQREPGVIDLTAEVKEQKTGQLNFGLQYDPEEALAGVVRYSQQNVGGTGQGFGIDLVQAATGGGPSITLDYTNPFIDTLDTTFKASVYSRLIYRFAGNLFGNNGVSFTNNQIYDERHTGGTFVFSRPLNDIVSGAVGLRLERVDTENLGSLSDNMQTPNDPSDDQTTNNFIQQDGYLGLLNFGLTRNRRDLDIDPSRGDYFALTVEPGYSDITHEGGQVSGVDILGPHLFTEAMADYRIYWSPEKPRGKDLDAPRKVLAFRIRYGEIAGNVPFFEQYFAGGSDTVRGYPDDRFWGRSTLLTNLELRIPVQKSFSLIGFFDYGGAWGGYPTIQGYTQSSDFRLHFGYGPGISFRTPLGNIQLFLGFNEDGGTQTHFLIGNSF